MSPSIQGADADQLDRLAVLFQEKAQQLDNLGNQVRRAVNQIHWEGGGWGRFRAEWDQQHHKRLRVSSQGLRQASDQLRAQAQDQRRVSGGDQRQVSGEGVVHGLGLVPVCALPTGHLAAGVMRTSFAWGDYISRIEDVADEDAFELLQVSVDPPKYIVLLPGIELEAWDTDTVRDPQAAVSARLLQRDAYAARVMLELQRAGVPAGSEVMLMGHSYGAIAAMNLASDPQFNQPGNGSSSGAYHVQVTHVVAAGAGLRDLMNQPPSGTDVLLSINRRDHVATLIQASRSDQSLMDSLTVADELPGVLRAARGEIEHSFFGAVDSKSTMLGDGRVLHEFTADNDFLGHHYDNYRTGFGVGGGAPAESWLDDAARRYFVGHSEMVATRITVKD